MDLLHSFLSLFSSEGIRHLVSTGGLPAICLIVFAETGFFALLPGDSLLVVCGMLAAPGPDGSALLPLPWLLGLVPVFAVLGDQVGYWLGSWVGKAVYGWDDFRLAGLPVYKKAYLKKTEDFYARFGSFTLVAGRWVPFVRTFAPLLAGVIRMRFFLFLTFNVIGGLTWVWSMLLAGYFLPPLLRQLWPGFDLAKNIDKIAVVVVFASLLPILYHLWRERTESRSTATPVRPPARRKRSR